MLITTPILITETLQGIGDILDNGKEEKYLKVLNNELQCLDCEVEDSIEFETTLNSKFKINKNGINAESDQVNVEISSNGISIKQKNN